MDCSWVDLRLKRKLHWITSPHQGNWIDSHQRKRRTSTSWKLTYKDSGRGMLRLSGTTSTNRERRIKSCDHFASLLQCMLALCFVRELSKSQISNCKTCQNKYLKECRPYGSTLMRQSLNLSVSLDCWDFLIILKRNKPRYNKKLRIASWVR